MSNERAAYSLEFNRRPDKEKCPRHTTLVFLLCTLPAVLAAAQVDTEVKASSESASDSIEQWSRNLDSASFVEREAAMKKLVGAGRAAIPALVEMVQRGSPEAVWRSMDILEQLSRSDDHELQDATAAALEEVVESSDRIVAVRAERVLRNYRVGRKQNAIMRLRTLGATVSSSEGTTSVQMDDRWKGGNSALVHLQFVPEIESLRLERSLVSDEGLTQLKGLDNLAKLYLGGAQIRGPGLAVMKDLPGLRFLSLKALKLEADAIQYLADATQIEHLGLDETQIGDDALAHLTGMKNLHTLWLNSTRVTDEGLKHLGGLVNLNKLILTATPMDGHGLAQLKGATGLRYLSLQHVKLTDDGMQHLAELKQLETLGLDDTLISDSGMHHLESLENLHTLWLNNTNVSDASIGHIKKLSKLQRLYLKGTKFSEKGALEMSKALPRCQLVR